MKANTRQELPGFYYDADKNRYFPVTSKRSKTSQDKHLCQGLRQVVNSVPQIGVLRLLDCREVGHRFTNRSNSLVGCNFQRQYLELQTSHPKVWKYGHRMVADGALERLSTWIQTEEGLKDLNVLTWGGSNGWLWISEIAPSHTYPNGKPLYIAEKVFPPAESSIQTELPPVLQVGVEYPLSSSKITAINRFRQVSDVEPNSNYAALVSSLGSAAEGGTLHILRSGGFVPFKVSKCITAGCSVWAAAWCGATRAALGTSKGAALVDLEMATLKWTFRSRSDVLCQQCDTTGNILLCGLRNGHISFVDIRMPSVSSVHVSFYQNRGPLFPTASRNLPAHMSGSNRRFHVSEAMPRRRIQDRAGNQFDAMKMGSAICSLVLLHTDEAYFLASAMNGIIQLWDRRLVGKGAVQSYEGHYNTHTMLQLGVDPTETLLASGGEDRMLRIWNVKSGRLLCLMGGFVSPATAICWPKQGYASSSKQIFDNSLPDENHLWGMWLGSHSELLYVHGATS